MKTILSMLLLLVITSVSAQTTVEDFSLPDASGKSVSLSQFSSSRGIAVIFTSQDCIYDQYYATRILNLASLYSGKVQFLLINANQEPGETAQKMAGRKANSLLPYLADKNQLAMEKLGARKTPEVVLLKTMGAKFQIVFQGGIDDNPQVASDARQFYLREAIEKMLNDQKIDNPLVRSAGCTIRKK